MGGFKSIAGGLLSSFGDGLVRDAQLQRKTMLDEIAHNRDRSEKAADEERSFGRLKELKLLDRESAKVTTLTAEEVAAAGQPKDTFGQRDGTGRATFLRPEKVTAPTTRTRIDGDTEKVEEWRDGKWEPVSGGPRYKPQATSTDPFEGRGLNAQMMNLLIKGDPSTPEFAAAYAQMSRPQTSFDQNGAPVYVTPDMSWARKPTGGANSTTSNATDSAPRAQLQGGAQDQMLGKPTVSTGDPVKGMEAPRAIVAANLEQAKKDVELSKSIFFPNGKFDRVTTGTGGVPLSKGRTGSQAIRRSVEVLLRLRTGATAPDKEVDNYTTMFSPSAFDSDEAAATKMQRLGAFYDDVETHLGIAKKGGGSGGDGTIDQPKSGGFVSAEDVRAAYRAGTLSRAEAAKHLRDQFGLQ